jgi:DNA invertase Pin-like site-specific DNA recombinase
MPKRVAIYVRVSTEKQEALNQLIQLKAYCERSDYLVVNEYVDIISGKETSRPMFDVMFSHAHQRLFDLVLFWDVSRFSRAGTLYTLQKLKELENCGVDWESYQEPYFKSVGDFKDVVLSIMATVAKIERERIVERTKAGLERARLNGKKIGKRGKDKKPRKVRRDRGIKRGVAKSSYLQLQELRSNQQ